MNVVFIHYSTCFCSFQVLSCIPCMLLLTYTLVAVTLYCSHTGRHLNGFVLSGSGYYKSSLYTSSSVEHEQYVAAGVSLCVVARCGASRLAMATMH